MQLFIKDPKTDGHSLLRACPTKSRSPRVLSFRHTMYFRATVDRVKRVPTVLRPLILERFTSQALQGDMLPSGGFTVETKHLNQ
ncbi:hypothetical protein E2C01_033637 [Portunus trituberculatus]|uniref:Uncharacterized protein n=1 Tax=Portunus trituberculatus TaxID=210409 RepID=A0A5B7F668_PORTR|nr:hypothetical protein [Portunus trituberculatus]